MRLALIADTYPPLRTSGAVQLRDLSQEFVRQGHNLTVILPMNESSCLWLVECLDGVQILRLRAPKTKDISYIRRTIGEFLMPFEMLRNFRKCPMAAEKWDGIVWYSPSIFHGPFVSALKRSTNCIGYLILRDIFPDWALDMGLIKKGVVYRFLDLIACYQYSVADVIGVQTEGNLKYFDTNSSLRRVEVLNNWLSDVPNIGCSISLEQSKLYKRKVFVYAGNMGVAQGMDILLDLAEKLQTRTDIGFLFVGRGREAKILASNAGFRELDNVMFRDEIPPNEIPGLYAQCHIGLIVLDPRHKTHNIPGKFLTYMQSGLPVLACINQGNDLANLIRSENVGKVNEDRNLETLTMLALELCDYNELDPNISSRCRDLYSREYLPKIAVDTIVSSIVNQ